jgi:hypothetical protein
MTHYPDVANCRPFANAANAAVSTDWKMARLLAKDSFRDSFDPGANGRDMIALPSRAPLKVTTLDSGRNRTIAQRLGGGSRLKETCRARGLDNPIKAHPNCAAHAGLELLDPRGLRVRKCIRQTYQKPRPSFCRIRSAAVPCKPPY